MKNAAQIKVLKDQHASLAADLAKLKGKEAEPEYKALKEKADAILTGITALEAADKAETESAKKFEALERQNAELLADKRKRDVKERVASLTVPAFAPVLSALFTYAAEHADVKVAVYTKKDGKEEKAEKTLGEIGDDMLGLINAQAKRLFSVVDDRTGRTTRPEATTGSDPAAEIDRLANEYLVKHPELKNDYQAALDQVCKENPELAKQYEESQNSRSN